MSIKISPEMNFNDVSDANPDLPAHFRLGADLNVPDKDTFYAPGAEGYIDYPAL